MNYSRITAACIAASILLLPACGPQYKPRALKPLSQKTAQFEETKNDITVRAQKMARHQSKELFGPSAGHFEKTNICPIQLTIKNDSEARILYDPAQTNLKFADNKSVASCLQYYPATIGSLIVVLGLCGIAAASLFAFPFVFMSAYAGYLMPIAGAGLATIAGILILTPSTSIYYAKTGAIANQEIVHDINSKTITAARTIKPHEELNAILFADKKSFTNTFEIIFENETNKEKIPFTIDFNK
jgi:outer membrane lipoprotein-sorting protein